MGIFFSDDDAGAQIGVLALGLGFAAHQVFKPYTLFNWGFSTVLAVLVFGFLVFGRPVHSSVSWTAN